MSETLDSRHIETADEETLKPRTTGWIDYLKTGPVASEKFMKDVDDLPIQERESLGSVDQAS